MTGYGNFQRAKQCNNITPILDILNLVFLHMPFSENVSSCCYRALSSFITHSHEWRVVLCETKRFTLLYYTIQNTLKILSFHYYLFEWYLVRAICTFYYWFWIVYALRFCIFILGITISLNRYKANYARLNSKQSQSALYEVFLLWLKRSTWYPYIYLDNTHFSFQNNNDSLHYTEIYILYIINKNLFKYEGDK